MHLYRHIQVQCTLQTQRARVTDTDKHTGIHTDTGRHSSVQADTDRHTLTDTYASIQPQSSSHVATNVHTDVVKLKLVLNNRQTNKTDRQKKKDTQTEIWRVKQTGKK